MAARQEWNEANLAKAAADIVKGRQHSAVDMTDENAMKTWAAALPPTDYLVISASSAAHGPFAMAELRQMFDAKFFGLYVTVREVLLKLRLGGAIMLKYKLVFGRIPLPGKS